ncbi:MAG: single-stranded-DNA-specific exonuclease RecJ [Oscillospiraceae bacterium]|nr:single-stranded-DNA-specific exonuclease RecJ [Oscillospiraceae bacterium]
MCYTLKYGIWNVTEPAPDAVNALVSSGYAPLTAMVLAARGKATPREADAYLCCDQTLIDPFRMRQMDLAAGRVALAIDRGEKIAVFGDYDVDGITATCLLTDFLRSYGADCVPYIPGRLEEGYGLNPIAIRQLHRKGVKLIVTVDCGITAVEEAKLCKELGIDLVITDHHECKEQLPEAIAVVDPHRSDSSYPHKDLSGVGVAFKLAAALSASQEQVLERYADMLCLGTVADVMPLQGENRVFVARGLELLRHTQRPGLAALMHQAGCDPEQLTANSVGYTLAPRINAAGRMGKIELAVELFLTDDPQKGEELAKALCDLNRQRQAVESEIYQQAIRMLPEGELPDAIVLAEETWHQGVVGIVASRIAEEYCCPTFLICLDGEHGKASSRSYGGFNLFSALTQLQDLLESYGGHELAAGFTIHASQIPAFRKEICRLAREFSAEDAPRTVLEADCTVKPELLSVASIDSLSRLEPCGNSCPKPLLVMEGLQVERLSQVGGGRHLRLRLRCGRYSIPAIFFSTTSESVSICQGDMVDVAFHPQVNEFRGERTVQLNLQDIRPHCQFPCSGDTSAYRALRHGGLTPAMAAQLLPDRATLATVWRYISSAPEIREAPMCLLRKIVRWSGKPLDLGQLLTCLDIFSDVELLEVSWQHKHFLLRPRQRQDKADLNCSRTMQRLHSAKES